jgi:Ca2+-binding EF-hand superfamily protein
VEAINSVEDAEEALENLGLYDGEAGHMASANVKDLNQLGDELVKERYEKTAEVRKLMDDVKHAFHGLAESAQKKRAALTKALQDQKDLNDKLCRAFADCMKQWNEYLKGHKHQLAASTSHPLEQQLTEVQKSLGDTHEAQDKLHSLEQHDQKVQARGLATNPHTNITLSDARAQWDQFVLLLQKKKQLLEEQLEESKRQGLTKEQMQEIEDNFNFFDKDRNGRLTRPELKVCLQSLGEESTPKDIAAILVEYDPKKNGFVLKDDFTRFMFKILGDSDTEEELVKSFKYLSYDKEFLLKEELSNVVNGKTFKDHHVAYLLKEMKTKDAGYDFITWNHEAFSR